MAENPQPGRSARGRLGVDLGRDEALVLYEWVCRFNQREDVVFDDQAEQRVLWDLEASLESLLVEPLSDNYTDLLAAARERVRDAPEGTG
jgi:hypothetical protein